MMSNEEWERKMEFLLNRQAQFDVNMSRLETAQAQTEKSLDRAAKNISQLAGFIHEGFGCIMNVVEETNAQIKELKESHMLTEEELQKFIAKVDRLTGEGQNGLQN